MEPAPVKESRFVIAGNATFTIDIPSDFCEKNKTCKSHYTYKVLKWKKEEKWSIYLLAGPDNTQDFEYLGMINPETGAVKLTKKSNYKPESWPVRIVARILLRLWANEMDQVTKHGFALMHEGRCGMCGKKLTTPESIELGLGPTCAAKGAW
jgi:hypothetical protein